MHVEIVGLCGATPIAQPQSARRKHLGTPKVDTKGVRYEYRVIQWSKNAPTFLPHPKDFGGPLPNHTQGLGEATHVLATIQLILEQEDPLRYCSRDQWYTRHSERGSNTYCDS